MEISGKYKALLSDFVELLKVNFNDNLCSVILYGSVVKGTAHKDSDIDVCLIFKALPVSRYKRILLIFPLLQHLREKESYKVLYDKGYLPEIVPILFTTEELQDTKPIFLDMVEDGLILLDDGTFKKKQEEVRQRMKELGTHKVILEDGDYYWVIKPGLRLGEEVTI